MHLSSLRQVDADSDSILSCSFYDNLIGEAGVVALLRLKIRRGFSVCINIILSRAP